MVAIGTLLAMLIRLYLSEVYLKKEQGISGNKNIVFELAGLSLFIIFGIIDNLYLGLMGHLMIYSLFLLKQSNEIKELAKYVLRR
jgi:hypothetical protein